MSSSSSLNDDVINFGKGHPDASLLPVAQIQQASQAATAEWLQYGSGRGSEVVRRALADFLTHQYYHRSSTTVTSMSTAADAEAVQHADQVVSAESLFITSGVSHGIALVCEALLRRHASTTASKTTLPPPLCLLEDPTYFLVEDIFLQRGYETMPVATTPQRGVSVEELEALVRKLRKDHPDRVLVLYTIPSHHNPLGISLNEQDRTRLTHLCNTYRLYLIADEVYHCLGEATPDMDDPDNNNDNNNDDRHCSNPNIPMAKRSPYIVSVSAMTKILCPGIRCGWIQADPELIADVDRDAVTTSAGCSAQLAAGVVGQLVTSGALSAYLLDLRREYTRRCQTLCRLLQEASDRHEHRLQFRFQRPRGGYFVWVQLVEPRHVRLDATFQSWCRDHYGVGFLIGTRCSPRGSSAGVDGRNPTAGHQLQRNETLERSMRLCFAYYDVSKLTQGVERLCQAILAYPREVPTVKI